MSKIVTTHGFVKIGKEEHIDDLQKSGVIFCNTVEYFRTLEGEEVGRKDIREGANSSRKIGDVSVFLGKDPAKELRLNIVRGHLNTYNSENLLTHLYCLYVIKSDHVTGKPFIDTRNITFGDKALLITDTKEFMNRFKKGAGEAIDYSWGFVNYYDDDQDHPRLTIYDKPNLFRYQSEFRFHIKNRSSFPISFEIGSIEDISIKLEAALLAKLWLAPPIGGDMQ